MMGVTEESDNEEDEICETVPTGNEIMYCTEQKETWRDVSVSLELSEQQKSRVWDCRLIVRVIKKNLDDVRLCVNYKMLNITVTTQCLEIEDMTKLGNARSTDICKGYCGVSQAKQSTDCSTFKNLRQHLTSFMGHILTQDQIKPTQILNVPAVPFTKKVIAPDVLGIRGYYPWKILEILCAKSCNFVHTCMVLLGAIGFVRKFIPNCARVLNPITELTSKGADQMDGCTPVCIFEIKVNVNVNVTAFMYHAGLLTQS